jgi:hypothetical protein
MKLSRGIILGWARENVSDFIFPPAEEEDAARSWAGKEADPHNTKHSSRELLKNHREVNLLFMVVVLRNY